MKLSFFNDHGTAFTVLEFWFHRSCGLLLLRTRNSYRRYIFSGISENGTNKL